MPSGVRVVLVTVPVHGEDGGSVGANLARVLVSEGIVACVNRIPGLTSTYLWEDELHEDAEELLVLKTTGGRIPHLVQRLRELHPYDVPEILVLNVDQGLPDYLDWVGRQCASRRGGPS